MSKKKQSLGRKAGQAAKAATKRQFPKFALAVRRPPRHQGR